MANETRVQEFVHKLEEGGWAKWIWIGLILAAVVYVTSAWLFRDNGFKGLTNPRAFEQAVIAREISRGNGFSTRIIRPAELWLFREHGKPYPVERIPDTYHAPLWPTVLAPFVGMVKNTWPMKNTDIQYTSDRVIVSVALGFFLLSVVMNFFLAWRLFDLRLAVMAAGLMLLCDQFWRFSMSGLPQMLMLFLFSGAVYALLRLLETYQTHQRVTAWEIESARVDLTVNRDEAPARDGGAVPAHPGEERPAPWALPAWAAAAGAMFGLLALTHSLTIWIFAGAVLFGIFYLRRARLIVLAPLLGVFLMLYSPWLIRNYQVCGSPTGVSWYAGLYQIRGSENSIMRSKDSPVNGATPTMFRTKVQGQLFGQMGNLAGHLGNVMLAPIFFIALMHLFKRPSTAAFRWCILLMWSCAIAGMCIFGLDEQTMKANDLHVLFIPLLTFYGLAFVLVMWSRLEINIRLMRGAFIFLLFLISGGPFIATFVDLHSSAKSQVEWPPYVPPYIAILRMWTKEQEIIMSDMPWAVAWYADRRSLWLPSTVKEFNELNDYGGLSAPIVGLYLTPVSSNQPFLNGLLTGEYQDWSPFILRTGIPRNFALRAVTVLPIQNQCTFYADRDRWSSRED